jgi:hypothetical protein
MGSKIEGIVYNKIYLSVSKFNLFSEGSGSTLYYVIEPALKNSKGVLIANIIWETGEIEQLVSIDGKIEHLDVKIVPIKKEAKPATFEGVKSVVF